MLHIFIANMQTRTETRELADLDEKTKYKITDMKISNWEEDHNFSRDQRNVLI